MYTLQRPLLNYCWWSSFKDQLLIVPSYSIELHRTLWLTLLRCIREVPGSNLGPETGCPDWRFNALMRMERAVRWGFDFIVNFSGNALVCNGRFWVRISSRCRIVNTLLKITGDIRWLLCGACLLLYSALTSDYFLVLIYSLCRTSTKENRRRKVCRK
jgi:hypothetical protein